MYAMRDNNNDDQALHPLSFYPLPPFPSCPHWPFPIVYPLAGENPAFVWKNSPKFWLASHCPFVKR